jgi:hypothetical protein
LRIPSYSRYSPSSFKFPGVPQQLNPVHGPKLRLESLHMSLGGRLVEQGDLISQLVDVVPPDVDGGFEAQVLWICMFV